MANLARPNGNDISQTANRSRDVVPQSGICTRCIDGCQGNCEVFKSTFRGREVLYPSPLAPLRLVETRIIPSIYPILTSMAMPWGRSLGMVWRGHPTIPCSRWSIRN